MVVDAYAKSATGEVVSFALKIGVPVRKITESPSYKTPAVFRCRLKYGSKRYQRIFERFVKRLRLSVAIFADSSALPLPLRATLTLLFPTK